MTIAESLANESALNAARWNRVTRTLQALAQCSEATQPEISIAAVADVTEGSDATFTIIASPAPTSDLSVSVSVSQSGDYTTSAGAQTITIPNSGTYTLAVSTTDDSTDEADGSITATIDTGTGYTVSSTAGAATVAVSDDDIYTWTPQATGCISEVLLANVRYYYNANKNKPPNYGENWKRVLIAFGDVQDDQLTPFTVADAWRSEQQWLGWNPIRTALTCLQNFDYDSAPPPSTLSGTPEISVTAGSDVTEGTAATFTITANPAPTANLDVSVSVTQSGDYTTSTGSQTITIPTSGTYTLTVSTTDDSADEVDGSITATIDTGTGYTVSTSNSAATVAVADDDPTPTPDPDAQEQDQGTSTDCTLPDDAITVAEVTGWRDALDPARAAAGITRWNRVLEALGDNTGTGVAAMTPEQAQDIADWLANTRWDRTARTLQARTQCDNPPATPQISIAAGSDITEGGNATFTITASPTPAADLDVTVTVSQSGDYASTGSRTVTISTTGSATLTVTTTNDSTDEPDGSVTATVGTGTGYTVSTSNGAATVAVADDDDPPATPEISIAAGSGITEGGDATFTITASPAPAADLTVNITVTQSGDNGATTGSQTVTVPTSGTYTLVVATSDDNTDEPDGTITATIDTGAGYSVSSTNSAATVNVADDDIPEITLTAGADVTEGADATFTVTAAPAPHAALDVTVTVSQTGDHGATSGSRTVTVPTSGTYTLVVATTNDSTDEPDGTITATIDDGTGYSVSSSDGAATVAVADDDPPDPPPAGPPTLSIADASASEGDAEGLRFVVTLSKASTQTITLGYGVFDRTAQQGQDFNAPYQTFTLNPGQTRLEIIVPVIDDTTTEPDETLNLFLYATNGITIPGYFLYATGTITDND